MREQMLLLLSAFGTGGMISDAMRDSLYGKTDIFPVFGLFAILAFVATAMLIVSQLRGK